MIEQEIKMVEQKFEAIVEKFEVFQEGYVAESSRTSYQKQRSQQFIARSTRGTGERLPREHHRETGRRE